MAGKKVFPLGIPEDIERLIYSFIPDPNKVFRAGKTYAIKDTTKIKGWEFFNKDKPDLTVTINKLTPKRIYFTCNYPNGREPPWVAETGYSQYSEHKVQTHKRLCLEGFAYNQPSGEGRDWERMWLNVTNCSVVGRVEPVPQPNITWAKHWK